MVNLCYLIQNNSILTKFLVKLYNMPNCSITMPFHKATEVI